MFLVVARFSYCLWCLWLASCVSYRFGYRMAFCQCTQIGLIFVSLSKINEIFLPIEKKKCYVYVKIESRIDVISNKKAGYVLSVRSADWLEKISLSCFLLILYTQNRNHPIIWWNCMTQVKKII